VTKEKSFITLTTGVVTVHTFFSVTDDAVKQARELLSCKINKSLGFFEGKAGAYLTLLGAAFEP
jgi:hypothetical protein